MIEDVEFVRDRRIGRLQVVERASEVAIGHIPARIIVGANDDHAGMPAAGGLDQKVQIAEVVVVLGNQHELVPNRVQQMKRIPYSRQSRVVWQDDAVATSDPLAMSSSR